MMRAFGVYLREQGRAERTVEAYLADVGRFVRWSEGEYGQAFCASMFNRADLREYQRWCRDELRLKASTWNRSVASLAVWGGWLFGQGLVGENASVALTRAEGQKLAPRSLVKPVWKRLRLAVSEAVRVARTEAGRRQAVRNAAVVACLWQAGMREGEVVRLHVQDVLLGVRSGRIEVVNAKGNKDRVIPLGYEAVQVLRAWLAVRPVGGEMLFVGKGGEALQERGVQKLVAGLARAAGVGHVTPHQLRHTAGKTLVDKGATLPEVAAFLGHASLEVTRRYTLPHFEDLEKLVEVL